jgi:hypothetical protein
MSFVELKERVLSLTPEERLELAALLAHLSQSDDPAYQATLDARMDAMDAGKKFGREDLDRLNRKLAAQGQ